MPIKIPEDLPASGTLEKEGVLLIKESDAIRQDVRPIRIALLNLMPKKIDTETQLARVLAGSPLQIENDAHGANWLPAEEHATVPHA